MQTRRGQSEDELAKQISLFLERQGYRVRREAPNMGQSVDIVATKGRWVTCVEVKINQWKRALNQCRAHRTVADYVSIAIAIETVPQSLLQQASDLGYGIIHVNRKGKCSIKLLPRLNRHIWKPQRVRFMEHLGVIDYGC